GHGEFLLDELMRRCVGVAAADCRAARAGAAMIALPKKSREDQVMSIVRRLALSAALALAAAGFAHGAAAQSAADYPSRPVKLIVPFPAGGPADLIARIIGQKLSEELGKQFYVENHSGAGGNIGTGIGARAPADGYSLLVNSQAFVINASLYKSLPYDPEKDFVAITRVATTPNVLVVHPSVPAKTVGELVELMRGGDA